MENEDTGFIEIAADRFVRADMVRAMSILEERSPKGGLEWYVNIDTGPEGDYTSRRFKSADDARAWARNFREAVQRKRQEAPSSFVKTTEGK